MNKQNQQSSYNVIHRDFTQVTSQKHSVGQNKVVWKQHSLLSIGLIVFAMALALTLILQIYNNLQQVNQLNQQIVTVQGEQQAVQAEQEALSLQVQLLQNDEYISKLARSEYYLSKKGEIIFSLPEDFTGSTSNKSEE